MVVFFFLRMREGEHGAPLTCHIPRSPGWWPPVGPELAPAPQCPWGCRAHPWGSLAGDCKGRGIRKPRKERVNQRLDNWNSLACGCTVSRTWCHTDQAVSLHCESNCYLLMHWKQFLKMQSTVNQWEAIASTNQLTSLSKVSLCNGKSCCAWFSPKTI